MTMLLRFITIITISLLGALCSHATDFGSIRFHNQQSDTTRINELLTQCLSQGFKTPGERVGWLARQLEGTPYVAHTLEGDTEMLTVNLDELDCTTFVDNVLALALTVGERRQSWRDFVYNLERIRYRGGTMNGYPSRLHYFSDWVVDNTHRDNLKEITARFPKATYQDKTIDFMSSNRGLYPALADSATFEGIKNMEIGYRRHRFPYLKPQDTYDKTSKGLYHEGDVVAFTTKTPGLDVAHLGLIIIENGQPQFIHASQSGGKVIIVKEPWSDFFKRNRQFSGMRVVRLND